MSFTFNSARQPMAAGLLPGPTSATPAAPHQAGLFISPEQGRPHRTDRTAILALVAFGIGFLVAATLFAAALISLALS